MSGEQIVALSKKHTLYEWSAQSKVDPIPVAKAKGIYFWTPEGKRFIDFNSQLMSVNVGHGEPRVIEAIHQRPRNHAPGWVPNLRKSHPVISILFSLPMEGRKRMR